MSQREDLRSTVAQEICRLPYSRLMEWDISRAADLTGLDSIGLPVYVSCRPPGTVITVSAGKGMSKTAAKAGAILEGVELWAAEHPSPDRWFYGDQASVERFGTVLSIDQVQLAHSALVYPQTQISWDFMDDSFRQGEVIVPSDLVWLVSRVRPPFQYFQTSSNGLAAGTDPADAMLQALYELVERDGWSISEHIRDQLGIWPDRISLQCVLPDEIQVCVNHLIMADVSPFLFDISTEFGIPTFGCTLLDAGEYSPGAFAGYGCSLDPVTAARRAITEACQARAAYIGAARDDLFRRKFVLMKKVQSAKLVDLYNSLPVAGYFAQYYERTFDTVEEEWTTLKERLQAFGISECYSKVLYRSAEPKFCIIRVVCPELSLPMWEHWQAGPRAIASVDAKLKSLQHA